MSLRDEIMTILSLRPDGNHADLTDEYVHAYIESQAEDVMDKLLDAAVEAIYSSDYEDSDAGHGAINNAEEAVNKLRPEK